MRRKVQSATALLAFEFLCVPVGGFWHGPWRVNSTARTSEIVINPLEQNRVTALYLRTVELAPFNRSFRHLYDDHDSALYFGILGVLVDCDLRSRHDVRAFPRHDVRAFPRLDVRASPRLDVRAFPRHDVRASPRHDVRAFPRHDVRASPRHDVRAFPRHDVRAFPRL